jgi:hypothetical protein
MTDSDPDALTARQESFCRHYVFGTSAAAAARAAGYSEATARSQGWRLLRQPAVQARIAALRADQDQVAATLCGQLWAEVEEIRAIALERRELHAALRAVAAKLHLFERLGVPVCDPEDAPDAEAAAETHGTALADQRAEKGADRGADIQADAGTDVPGSTDTSVADPSPDAPRPQANADGHREAGDRGADSWGADSWGADPAATRLRMLTNVDVSRTAPASTLAPPGDAAFSRAQRAHAAMMAIQAHKRDLRDGRAADGAGLRDDPPPGRDSG